MDEWARKALEKIKNERIGEMTKELQQRKNQNLKYLEYILEKNPGKFFYEFRRDKSVLRYQREKELDKKSPDKFLNIPGNTIAKIKSCASYFEYVTDITYNNKKCIKAIKCNNRFCAYCAKQKSIIDAVSYQAITNYILDNYEVKLLFLTLTAPNVKGEELEQEIRDYYKVLDKFFKSKLLKTNIYGYLGKLEVTYNNKRASKSYKTYHPHFHYILVVPNDYNKNMARDELLKIWQRVKKDDSITQLDIRVTYKKNEYGIYNNILELTKYIAKDSNYLLNIDTIQTFYNALKGKRQYRSSGIYKKSIKLFKAGKLDEYISSKNIEYYYKLIFHKHKNYKAPEILKLTEKEKQSIQDRYKKDIVKEFNIDL